jgi:hypothetical protein
MAAASGPLRSAQRTVDRGASGRFVGTHFECLNQRRGLAASVKTYVLARGHTLFQQTSICRLLLVGVLF